MTVAAESETITEDEATVFVLTRVGDLSAGLDVTLWVGFEPDTFFRAAV